MTARWGIIGAVGCFSLVTVTWSRRRQPTKRDEEIGAGIGVAATAFSSQTVRTLLQDPEIVSQLKKLGIELIKDKETRESLKTLVKNRAKDPHTRQIAADCAENQVVKDAWVREELIAFVLDVKNELVHDSDIRGSTIDAVKDCALESAKSPLAMETVKSEVGGIVFDILRGSPLRPPP